MTKFNPATATEAERQAFVARLREEDKARLRQHLENIRARSRELIAKGVRPELAVAQARQEGAA